MNCHSLDLCSDVIWLDVNFPAPINFTWNLPDIITAIENSVFNVVTLHLIDLNVEEVLGTLR